MKAETKKRREESGLEARKPGFSKWGLDEGDLGLIRWMLSLSPTERLRYAQGFAQSVNILRHESRS